MITYKEKEYVCHLDLAMDLIRGKWKAIILCHIQGKPKRFLELKRMTQGISQKVLSENLTDLENDGLIIRKVYAQVPPKVEYSLSQMGIDLFPVLDCLENWSHKYF